MPAARPPILRELRPSDRASLERILRATGAFDEAEVAVALELIDAPPEEGYRFIVAEIADRVATERGPRVAGYACYGATPETEGTYDLYWIVVDPDLHGRGIGRTLMSAAESAIRRAGGRVMLIETAGKPSYARQRAFYEANGCELIERVPDFYAAGDDKLVYERRLEYGA